jgi:glycosyltransferase involved in cell wall biosynthesis
MEREQSPVLTVGIPTWNRASYLAEGVDALAAEIERHGLQREVEILISDNASDDGTRAAGEARAARHTFVRYSRNERNRGVKYNFLHTMRSAAGSYCMILGDDDRLAEGSLASIVARLRVGPEVPVMFVQSAGAARAFEGVERETLLTPEEVYGKYFYDIGNTGLFILNSREAREIIARHGIEFFNDIWPQTQVMALSLAGRGRAALFSPIEAVNSSMHEALTVYSSYYLWHLAFAELFTAARDLRPVLGESFWRATSDYLCSQMKGRVNDILFYASLVDTKEQRRKTAASIRRLLPLLPRHARREAFLLWLHAAPPRAVVAALYRARISLFYGSAVIENVNGRARAQVEKREAARKERAVREGDFFEPQATVSGPLA